MTVTINGSGTIDGISQGGLNDNIITTNELVDLNVTPAKLSQKLTLGTAATASGTFVDFTGIPSWVKRITVSFRNISTTGNLNFGVRVGTASGIVTSGYLGTVSNYSAATSNQYSSNELIQTSISNAGGNSWSGTVVLINSESNFWVANTNLAITNTNGGAYGAGHINAAAALTTIRIMALSTETFDGGSINILYEG